MKKHDEEQQLAQLKLHFLQMPKSHYIHLLHSPIKIPNTQIHSTHLPMFTGQLNPSPSQVIAWTGVDGFQRETPVLHVPWKSNPTVDGRNPAPVDMAGKYPIVYRVLYIPGGAGFLPSTVSLFPSHLTKN